MDGQSSYVWYAGNDQVAMFHIDPSRGSEVATHLLGEHFQGCLVTDGYAAYNAVGAASRQTCLAHLIRKAKEIAEEIALIPEPQQDKQALRFCKGLRRALCKACELGGKLADGSLSLQRAARLLPHLYSLIDIICSTRLAYPKAEKLRQRILDPKRVYLYLFTFMTTPGVDPTNNHAERTLRTPVI